MADYENQNICDDEIEDDNEIASEENNEDNEEESENNANIATRL